MESAFAKFGGVPEEVLLDNARALVVEHDPASREVVFNEKLQAFAKHWGFRPRPARRIAPAPRARPSTASATSRGTRLPAARFPSWEALEAHLEAWTREVADVRVHGTTGETPIERFSRDEAKALQVRWPGCRPSSCARADPAGAADCAIEIDGNAYSVPWRLIGETVRVDGPGGIVRIHHAGRRGGRPCRVESAAGSASSIRRISRGWPASEPAAPAIRDHRRRHRRRRHCCGRWPSTRR